MSKTPDVTCVCKLPASWAPIHMPVPLTSTAKCSTALLPYIAWFPQTLFCELKLSSAPTDSCEEAAAGGDNPFHSSSMLQNTPTVAARVCIHPAAPGPSHPQPFSTSIQNCGWPLNFALVTASAVPLLLSCFLPTNSRSLFSIRKTKPCYAIPVCLLTGTLHRQKAFVWSSAQPAEASVRPVPELL